MRGGRAIRWCGLAAVVASCVAALATGRGLKFPAPVRPNVLLVSIDSLRADHLGAYGYGHDTSPAIDALARDGVLFEQAISPAPWTIPSHMTLLTGLSPEVHGVVSRRHRLSPDAITLAEVLRDAGYDTAAFVSGPTVMRRYGFDQGFGSYDESMVQEQSGRPGSVVTSPGLVERVGGYLEGWSAGGRKQPFFVFLHMWDVHYDYVPPAEYVSLFDPDYAGDLDATGFEGNPRLVTGMPSRDLQHLIALYDGEIRFTDDHLARIVARLREMGVLDDTVLIVTADHGDEFFEHGQKGHAKTLYDEVLRVPLVIRYPHGIAAGQRVAGQVRLMDVAPTVLGLAGVPQPAGFAGAKLAPEHRAVDLTAYVTGTSRPPLPALVAIGSNRWLGAQQHSVRTTRAKLIRNERAPPNASETELYDIEKDPGERRNLRGSAAEPALLSALAPKLDASLADARAARLGAVELVPAPRHEARLRALGYVE